MAVCAERRAKVGGMRILVTGGNGFVGRSLVRSLLDEHDVAVVDNLRYGGVRFSETEESRISLIQTDIRDPDETRLAIESHHPDAIIHLAAIHYIPECQDDPSLAVATNVLGTVNLLEACPAGTRFVLASSAAVYQNSDRALVEDTSPLGPNDIYGRTKLQAEEYLSYFAAWRDFPAVAVRLFNVVGPGETNRHVLPEIVAQMKAGHRSLRLGNITPRRDFIHVADAAAGFAAAAIDGDVEAGTTTAVNLGRGEAHSVQDLLDLLAVVIGEEITVATDPARFRRADNPLLLADITRIGEVFGWRPARDLREAVEDLWADPDLPPGLVEQYRT